MPGLIVGMFYQAVLVKFFLYGIKLWFLPLSILKIFLGFHLVAAWRVTGMQPQKVKGVWIYPKSVDVMADTWIHPIEYYIAKRRLAVDGFEGNRGPDPV